MEEPTLVSLADAADGAAVASAALAAASATASWRSALVAREAASRSNAAFVWPSVRIGRDGDVTRAWVRFFNDGPGLARDVVAARLELGGPQYKKWAVHDRTPAIRGLRSHETLPPADQDDMALGVHAAGDDVWAVAVRWTDTAGERWEYQWQPDSTALASAPSRLRRRWWQRWRPASDW